MAASRRLGWWLLALTVLVCACSRQPDRSTVAVPPAAQPTSPVRAETTSIRSKLAVLTGSFQWNEEMKAYVYSDKRAIEPIVGAATDEIVRDLVDCLDDSQPSQSTLKGQRVAVGVVCYEALTQIVYYEPTTAKGDIASSWPGHIDPTAKADQLGAAKREWRDVVDKKAYKRL